MIHAPDEETAEEDKAFGEEEEEETIPASVPEAGTASTRQYFFQPGPEEVKMRLDLFLQKMLPELSRTRLADLIECYLVKVNGKVEKPSHKMRFGEHVNITIPPPTPVEILPQPYPLKVVYEDEDMIVINKDIGVTVHPTAGNFTDTLVNHVLHHCKDLSGIGGELRPGVVHRLDKDTSGLIVMAKHDTAHIRLAAQFKDRTVEKYYNAVVKGAMPYPEGYIRKSIIRDPAHRQRMFATDDLKLGKSALTSYEVIENFQRGAFLRIRIHTGRTHQIRVHFASIGHPLVGDPIYLNRMKKIDLYGLALVSKELKIRHPMTGQELFFSVPLPAHIEKILRIMRDNQPDEEGPDLL
jgi:23S rRNA pseudouridine1911/1915/1917 synthase